MRVKLANTDLANLFGALGRKGLDIKAVSQMLGVSPRTVTDWRRGKFSMPKRSYEFMLRLSALEQELLKPVYIDERRQKSTAGKKGGIAYKKLYGNPGTAKSRRSGGMASYRKQLGLADSMFAKKEIKIPETDGRLAEFIGIMIGDGSISSYQISISLNMSEDREYANYVINIVKNLFCVQPYVQIRDKSNCIVIMVSSVNLVHYLCDLGLPKGDKLKGNIDIPSWVRKDKKLLKSCLRGMFDTDGCIFEEKHIRAGGIYKYPRLNFTSTSPRLVSSIYDSLCKLGFYPVSTQPRRVNITRFTDIEKYFIIIGSSNPKHLRRFAAFGGVG